MKKSLLLLPAVFLLLPLITQSAFCQDVWVDPVIKFQKITGWEATAQAGQDSIYFDKYKDTLYDLSVNTLGINRLRLEVTSGAENSRDFWFENLKNKIDQNFYQEARYSTVNDNDDPNTINWEGFKFSELDSTVEKVVIPFKSLVEKNGDKFFLNLNYVAFTNRIGLGLDYGHNNPAEYAEFVLATCLHLKNKYNLVPDFWEVILEPDRSGGYWRSQTIGQSIVAAAQKLKENGFDIKFIAPSASDVIIASDYFEWMAIEVPEALKYIAELCYHRTNSKYDNMLLQIRNDARSQNINTSMLGYDKGNYIVLYYDLTVANVTAWQQYMLASSTEYDLGSQYFLINPDNPDKPVISMGKRTPYLAQFFKYVREGAQRVEAVSTRQGIFPAAFISKDGAYVVITVTDAAGNFEITGVPDGTYGITYTTADKSIEPLADAVVKDGSSIMASMPGQGVITVFQKKPASAGDDNNMLADVSVWPNPAGEGTRIGVFVPVSGRIRLSVHNSVGAEVSVLADGFAAQGINNFDFSTGGLASGIYYYRLVTSGITKTGSIVVSR